MPHLNSLPAELTGLEKWKARKLDHVSEGDNLMKVTLNVALPREDFAVLANSVRAELVAKLTVLQEHLQSRAENEMSLGMRRRDDALIAQAGTVSLRVMVGGQTHIAVVMCSAHDSPWYWDTRSGAEFEPFLRKNASIREMLALSALPLTDAAVATVQQILTGPEVTAALVAAGHRELTGEE